MTLRLSATAYAYALISQFTFLRLAFKRVKRPGESQEALERKKDQSKPATHQVHHWVDMKSVPGRKGEKSCLNMQSQQNIVMTGLRPIWKANSQTCTVTGRQVVENNLQNCSDGSRVTIMFASQCKFDQLMQKRHPSLRWWTLKVELR